MVTGPGWHGRNDHGHCCGHCPQRCPTCGPDADAWLLGELVMAPLVVAAALLAWLVRHPRAAVVVGVVGLVAALVWLGW